MSRSKFSEGLLWGLVSYSLWGFFPVYWKLLAHIPALEILVHRMVWSFAFYLALFLAFAYRQWPTLFKIPAREWRLSAVAAVVLSFNWWLYIYAVNTGHILEGSLAYFINPILNVAVGVIFFNEAFPLILKLSVGAAALGVATKLFFSPTLPWMSLGLALSFCIYGVTKKLMRIPVRSSSVLEGAIGFIPALIAVFYFREQSPIAIPPLTWILLALGGVVTGLPLFLFSFAAQRVPYSVMGMLQFIAPSLQFLVAVSLFDEKLFMQDAVAFAFIWLGMFFYLGFQAYTLKVRR